MKTIKEGLLENGIALKSYAQGTHRLPCPVCSSGRKNKNDPCLSVTIDGDSAVYYCHHCEASGQNFSGKVSEGFEPYKRKPKVDYDKPKTLQEVLNSNGILDWFKGRGIEAKTVNDFNIAQTPKIFEGKQRMFIAFNYYRDGELVSVKYRRAVNVKPYGYSQEKGCEQIFYGLHLIQDQPKEIIITEGEIDCMSVYQATGKAALSVPTGAKADYKNASEKGFHFLEDQRELINGAERIVIMTDGDEAGRGLANELSRRIGRDKCFRVRYPEGCKDANDILLKLGSEAIAEVITDAEAWPIRGVHSVYDYEAEVFEDYEGLSFDPLTTGFDNLDDYMKIVEGQMSIVTGIPNSGKSEFLDQILLNMARIHGWKFGICSFENKPQHHIRKFLEKHIGAPFYSDGPTRRMTKAEVSSGMEYLNKYFKFIRYNDWRDATPTIDHILGQASMLVKRFGIKGLVIDPYNELDRPLDRETEYVSLMLAKVRQFAESHDCHVWFVAHPKKMVTMHEEEVPVPTAYDIAGSARWADKGDMIWAVSRDRRDLSKPVEVHIHKVRDKYAGQVGCAYFHYDRLTGRYTPAAPQIEQVQYGSMPTGTEWYNQG